MIPARSCWAVADGLVLVGTRYLFQIHVIQPDVRTVAHNHLFVRTGVRPFEQAGAQDLECAGGGLVFVAGADGLRKGAADAVCIAVELFECVNRACLRLCGHQADDGGAESGFPVFHHSFSFVR